MKKNYLLFMLLLLIPSLVFANSKYEIKSYDTEITVNKDDLTYHDVVEVDFKNELLIFPRELPKSISDLKVSENYIVSSPYNKLVEISIFDIGNKVINYDYKNNYQKNNNDIYELEIKNTFEDNLNNIKFTINLPSPVNKNNLEFYLNDQEIKDINYKIKDNKIIGELSLLKENESLKIKVNYGILYLNNISIIAIIVPIILSLLCLLLWYIYGKDLRIPIEKVSKISNKFNPLDVSLISNGKVEESDAFYLLLSLANRGYIKIVENSNNDYTLIRDKKYDGKKYSEATFIKELFRKRESVSLADYINIISERKKNNKTTELEQEIGINSLTARFHQASNTVLSIINNQEERNKYFEDISEKMKVFLVLSIAIILVLVTSLPFIEINNLMFLPLSVIFSITTLFVLMKFVETYDFNKKNSKITILAILSIIVLLIILIPSFKRNRIYLLAYLISCISVTFILFLYKYMPKRTLYGTKEYTKIEGFKLFIKELSNKELDSILELNNNYLYDILPYSYMFKLSDPVLRKLKERKAQEPSWFVLKDSFSIQKLHNAINRLKLILEDYEKKN